MDTVAYCIAECQRCGASLAEVVVLILLAAMRATCGLWNETRLCRAEYAVR